MKKSQMTLTYEQARDLKWFCKNVVGVRQDYYEIFDKARGFDERISRLEKTCAIIEKFLGEKIEPFENPFKEQESERGKE